MHNVSETSFQSRSDHTPLTEKFSGLINPMRRNKKHFLNIIEELASYFPTNIKVL